MKLFTVGYESLNIDDFTTFLKKKKIKMIADVRKNPVSRKKGFSKHKMAAALAEKKIEYLHLPALGVPSAWRKEAKEHVITRQKMFNDYVRKILPDGEEELTIILEIAAKKNVAILCYEADASDCHRHYVVERLRQMTVEVIDVTDLQPLLTTKKRSV